MGGAGCSTPYRVCTGPSIPKVGTKVTTADVTKAQLTGFLLGGGPIVCQRGDSRGVKATGVIIRPAVITIIIPLTVMTVEAGDERWSSLHRGAFGLWWVGLAGSNGGEQQKAQ